MNGIAEIHETCEKDFLGEIEIIYKPVGIFYENRVLRDNFLLWLQRKLM